jgi:hypothetical protein
MMLINFEERSGNSVYYIMKFVFVIHLNVVKFKTDYIYHSHLEFLVVHRPDETSISFRVQNNPYFKMYEPGYNLRLILVFKLFVD